MTVIIEITLALLASVVLGWILYRFAIREEEVSLPSTSEYINGDLDHISEEARRIRTGAESIERRVSRLRDLDESRRVIQKSPGKGSKNES